MPSSIRELRAVLPEIFEELSGLPAYHENSPRPQAPGLGTCNATPEDPETPPEKLKLAWLLLNITTLEDQGGNDERRVEDVGEDQIQTVVVKQKRFRLDVKCESFDCDDPAIGYLDDLSTAMSSQKGKALLLSNDISLIGSGIALSRDTALGKFDNRIWSVAVQDMQFTVVLNVAEEPTGEWIECVGLVPCFSGADGELLSEKNNREQTVCRPPSE